MNTDLVVPISLWLSGFASFLIIYYSTAINRSNSAQLERFLRINNEGSDESYFQGIRLSLFKISLQIASLFCEIFFLLFLAAYLFSPKLDLTRAIAFCVIGIAYEIFSRTFLPSGLPLRGRTGITSIEKLLFSFLSYVFFPVAYTIEKASRYVLRTFHPKTDSERLSDVEDAIKSIIDVGEKEGLFKDDDGELIQSIVDFSETIVREVMSPRIDLQSVEINQHLDDFISVVIETGYSKIPVYRQRIDNIEGILYAKDVLKYWKTSDVSVRLEEIIRPPYFIPETKKVRDLLREFQGEKIHMAVVVDEYGGVAGIVTIEDLLEEIVGEIHDEYDVEQKLIHPLGENSWLADARIDLDELEEIINFEFPRDSYETLGGFLFDQMGHVPVVGEKHDYENLGIEIKEANDRQILRVVIQRRTPAEDQLPMEDQSNEKQ